MGGWVGEKLIRDIWERSGGEIDLTKLGKRVSGVHIETEKKHG